MINRSVAVLVVDDQAPFRSVARMVVTMTPGFDVVDEAETGEAAVASVATSTPDIVLMDINLPGMSGIVATKQILATRPHTVVILLSTYGAEDLPGDARDCGAVRYVHKEDFEPSVLVDAWEAGQHVG